VLDCLLLVLAGAFVVPWLLSLLSSPPIDVGLSLNIHDPPCEQGLTMVMVSAGHQLFCPSPSLSSSLFHLSFLLMACHPIIVVVSS
jgi:hypothetical protein